MRNIFKRVRKNKKRSFKIIKYLLFLFIIYLAYDTTYAYLIDARINISNEEYIRLLLSESNHHIIYKDKPKSLINQAITFLANIDLSKPASILNISFLDKKDDSVAVDANYSDDYNPEALEKVTDYIKDPNPIAINIPLIYIYNSHQLENYNAKNLEVYNIKPNVMMASYMLKEKLNNLSIPSIVEDSNITEFMRINNWSRADSYKASRMYLLDARTKNTSLKYFIDIHRDSIREKDSTVTINNLRYAKVMFVVGLDNKNYKGNLETVEAVNKIINNKYQGISRGILKKQGAGVDGVYNQDISSKMMLLEIGGVDNTIEDVLNTIEALSHILYEYIRGDK